MQETTALIGLASLAGLAVVLGLRHGFDADHLAAIDGITRFNATPRPDLARRAGFWFSFGHGLVVAALAVAIVTFARGWQAPPWLGPLGAWISIAVLAVFGAINLRAGLRAVAGSIVSPAGLRAGLAARLLTVERPSTIMAVGALFALSFDTLSQAALLVVSGNAAQGWEAGVLLAFAFAAGMVLADSLSGWIVARLIAKADGHAAQASQAMCIAVAVASLGTAALGAVAQASSAVDAWASAHAGVASLLVIGAIVGSFLLGLAWSFRPRRLAALER